jgi:hypothetical protein
MKPEDKKKLMADLLHIAPDNASLHAKAAALAPRLCLKFGSEQLPRSSRRIGPPLRDRTAFQSIFARPRIRSATVLSGRSRLHRRMSADSRG